MIITQKQLVVFSITEQRMFYNTKDFLSDIQQKGGEIYVAGEFHLFSQAIATDFNATVRNIH